MYLVDDNWKRFKFQAKDPKTFVWMFQFQGFTKQPGALGPEMSQFSHFDFDQKIIEMQIPSWRVFESLEWYPRVNIQTDAEPPGFPKKIIPKWWFFHIWPCHTISLGKRMPAETNESWIVWTPCTMVNLMPKTSLFAMIHKLGASFWHSVNTT
jgi:hypothetical protein